MPLRVDNVRQASIGTIAKMNDTLRNASHASAFATYRGMKCMGGAWKESKELDVRAQAFQLISIFNWKLDRECIDGVAREPGHVMLSFRRARIQSGEVPRINAERQAPSLIHSRGRQLPSLRKWSARSKPR